MAEGGGSLYTAIAGRLSYPMLARFDATASGGTLEWLQLFIDSLQMTNLPRRLLRSYESGQSIVRSARR